MRYILVCLGLFMLLAASAYAAEQPWMIRGRILSVIPDESSNITPIGGETSISTSFTPEVDVSYFFTPNIAVELIAAVTKHDVTAKNTALGTVDVGSAWLLPPTLTLQYHFTNFSCAKPYVGAGINYTHFFNEKSGALSSVEYDDSFGAALQAGVDIPVEENWGVNLDVKRLFIDTKASFNNGAVVADVDIDPWLVGAGLYFRF